MYDKIHYKLKIIIKVKKKLKKKLIIPREYEITGTLFLVGVLSATYSSKKKFGNLS